MHQQHKEERAKARTIARAKYPYTKTLCVFGEGTVLEHDIPTFSDYPQYEREYIKQLKLVRANRKLKRKSMMEDEKQ